MHDRTFRKCRKRAQRDRDPVGNVATRRHEAVPPTRTLWWPSEDQLAKPEQCDGERTTCDRRPNDEWQSFSPAQPESAIQPTENIAIPATSAANPTAKAVPAAAGESPAAKITGMKSTAPRPHSQLGIVIVVVSRSAATITRAGKTAEMTKLNKSVSLSLVVAAALHRGAGD